LAPLFDNIFGVEGSKKSYIKVQHDLALPEGMGDLNLSL
jgi:hypothetical protein